MTDFVILSVINDGGHDDGMTRPFRIWKILSPIDGTRSSEYKTSRFVLFASSGSAHELSQDVVMTAIMAPLLIELGWCFFLYSLCILEFYLLCEEKFSAVWHRTTLQRNCWIVSLLIMQNPRWLPLLMSTSGISCRRCILREKIYKIHSLLQAKMT